MKLIYTFAILSILSSCAGNLNLTRTPAGDEDSYAEFMDNREQAVRKFIADNFPNIEISRKANQFIRSYLIKPELHPLLSENTLIDFVNDPRKIDAYRIVKYGMSEISIDTTERFLKEIIEGRESLLTILSEAQSFGYRDFEYLELCNLALDELSDRDQEVKSTLLLINKLDFSDPKEVDYDFKNLLRSMKENTTFQYLKELRSRVAKSLEKKKEVEGLRKTALESLNYLSEQIKRETNFLNINSSNFSHSMVLSETKLSYNLYEELSAIAGKIQNVADHNIYIMIIKKYDEVIRSESFKDAFRSGNFDKDIFASTFLSFMSRSNRAKNYYPNNKLSQEVMSLVLEKFDIAYRKTDVKQEKAMKNVLNLNYVFINLPTLREILKHEKSTTQALVELFTSRFMNLGNHLTEFDMKLILEFGFDSKSNPYLNQHRRVDNHEQYLKIQESIRHNKFDSEEAGAKIFSYLNKISPNDEDLDLSEKAYYLENTNFPQRVIDTCKSLIRSFVKS